MRVEGYRTLPSQCVVCVQGYCTLLLWLLCVQQVAQEIKYAKNLYDEKMQTLREMDEPDDTDW